jgi:hypothetical protein
MQVNTEVPTMSMKERIHLFEEDSKILETIANQYAAGPREYVAVKHAAIALWYVLVEDHERFKDYVVKFEGDLTAEQRAHLAAMGIDPDSEPNQGEPG